MLGLCVFLFTSSIVVIKFFCECFGGCGKNIAFITAALVIGLISTIFQLMGEETSLFTSACVFGYTAHLCYMLGKYHTSPYIIRCFLPFSSDAFTLLCKFTLYNVVSQNLNEYCNPELVDNNAANIVIGIGVAIDNIWPWDNVLLLLEKKPDKATLYKEV